MAQNLMEIADRFRGKELFIPHEEINSEFYDCFAHDIMASAVKLTPLGTYINLSLAPGAGEKVNIYRLGQGGLIVSDRFSDFFNKWREANKIAKANDLETPGVQLMGYFGHSIGKIIENRLKPEERIRPIKKGELEKDFIDTPWDFASLGDYPRRIAFSQMVYNACRIAKYPLDPKVVNMALHPQKYNLHGIPLQKMDDIPFKDLPVPDIIAMRRFTGKPSEF